MPNNITAELRVWYPHVYGNFKVYWGNVYGDTKNRWPDGRSIRTSYVVKEEVTSDTIIVTTRNSIYELKKDQSLEALINKKENDDGAGEVSRSEASV